MQYSIVYFAAFLLVLSTANGSTRLTKHANWNLINAPYCGETTVERIIGGKIASLGQYPWLVRLGLINARKQEAIFTCGGSLINPMYVLTAAHCVSPLLPKIQLVRLGENFLKTNPDCEIGLCAPPVQDIPVSKIIIHYEYNAIGDNENDIALVRLAFPPIMHEFVRPICMPVTNPVLNSPFVGSGTNVEVAGWGVMNINTKEQSSALLYVKVPIVSMTVCSKFYGVEMSNKQICAGGIVGSDSCQGDSGGPLMRMMYAEGTPRYFIDGIVSFGDKICGSKNPAVYTRVSSYMVWILDNIAP